MHEHAPPILTFPPASFNVVQAVNVAGVQELDLASDAVTLVLSGPSLAAVAVAVTVTDDDVP